MFYRSLTFRGASAVRSSWRYTLVCPTQCLCGGMWDLHRASHALVLTGRIFVLSITTCAASIAIRCFSVINGTPDPVSRILLAIFWSITLASIFWSFLTGWEFANHAHWSGALKKTHKSKVHGTCKEIRAMNDTHRAESTNYLSCIEKAGEY